MRKYFTKLNKNNLPNVKKSTVTDKIYSHLYNKKIAVLFNAVIYSDPESHAYKLVMVAHSTTSFLHRQYERLYNKIYAIATLVNIAIVFYHVIDAVHRDITTIL